MLQSLFVVQSVTVSPVQNFGGSSQIPPAGHCALVAHCWVSAVLQTLGRFRSSRVTRLMLGETPSTSLLGRVRAKSPCAGWAAFTVAVDAEIMYSNCPSPGGFTAV